jgi:soluble lytic murein transglycosylase
MYKKSLFALQAGILFCFCIPIAPAEIQTKTPAALELKRSYPARVDEALRGLARAVRLYDEGAYESASRQMPGQDLARSTAVGDYFLLYRAKAHLAADRPGQAVELFQTLCDEYPSSPLQPQAIVGQCRALLAEKKAGAARSLLQNSRLGGSSEILFLQGSIEEAEGQTSKAIDLYLRLYVDYPTAKQSLLAFDRLHVLSPGLLMAPAAYELLLRRAENLMTAGMNREAQSTLRELAAIAAPNQNLSARRWILLAQAESNLGKSGAALAVLDKATDTNPIFQEHVLYLKAVCYRRLKQESEFPQMRNNAVRLYPDSPFTEKLLYSAATYFDVEGRLSEARGTYQQLLEMFPKGNYFQTALWKVPFYSYVEGRYYDALSGFWNYLKFLENPHSAVAPIYWMARCYENLGDPNTAAILYRRAAMLGGHGYYGRLASEAGRNLQNQKAVLAVVHPRTIQWTQVNEFLTTLRPPENSIANPSPAAAQIIECARQLYAGGLSELALAELRPTLRELPGDKGLSLFSARIYAEQGDYDSAFRTLRRAFPDYDCRAIENLPEEVWNLLYPFEHWRIVSKQAAVHGLDPSFVMGLIRQESAFNQRARSAANARGLMQVLPSTGRVLAKGEGIKYSTEKLYQPDVNINLGVKHLAALIRQYEGREELALAAFNAGDTRVALWMSRAGKIDMPEFVERIPFSETRGYVKQVLTNTAYYRELNGYLANSQVEELKAPLPAAKASSAKPASAKPAAKRRPTTDKNAQRIRVPGKS